VKVFEWHSKLAERLRLKLGWSHYAIYWVSFIKGVGRAVVVFEDKAPITVPMPIRAAPSMSCFIGEAPLGFSLSRIVKRKKPPNYL